MLLKAKILLPKLYLKKKVSKNGDEFLNLQRQFTWNY